METIIQKEDGGYLIEDPGMRRKISTSPGAMADHAIKLTKAEIKKALKDLKPGQALKVEMYLTVVSGNPDPGTD